MSGSTPKVSVVVPVFRPGGDMDELLASLAAQSMAADEFEVILVDDGSGDGTRERLERVAAERPGFRVEGIEHTGWPSRPRNVGLELARGEYVFFADQDDRLDPRALERLHARASQDGADVVVGKVVGHGRPVPATLFRENRRDVTLEWEPLMRLLTPHKLFRRAFLEEHGIRFPEDGKRLEDHVFVLQAYFRTSHVSVLADHPVYHWVRRPGRNASYRRLQPESYYARVGELLALVDANTEPGPLRDQLYAHYLRSKLLTRLSSTAFVERKARVNRRLYESIQTLVAARFSPEVERRLPFAHRVRGGLLRDDDFRGLKALARFESRLRTRPVLLGVDEDGDARTVRLEAGLVAAGKPLTVRMRGVRLEWQPPERLGEALGRAGLDLDLAPSLERASLDAVLVSNADRSEFPLPARSTVRLDPLPESGDRFTPVLVAEVRVDPRTAAAGGPLAPGRWRLAVTVGMGGFSSRARRVRDLAGTKRRVRFEVGPEGRLGSPPRARDGAMRRLGRAARARVPISRGRRRGGAAGRAGRRRPRDVPGRA